jgi:amidohydrolase
MLRADIDALPQNEKTNIPWKSSVPGVMHACGHDLHTTALCGAALLICRMKQGGRALPTIDLVFQPSEEDGAGAKMLIDAGLFDRIHPKSCFGMHNWPSIEIGKAVCREGALMASLRNIDVVVHGAGGHGSMPHQNIDPIVCAAAMIQSLQTVVSRNVNPLEAGILSINMIEGGSPVNLVVDKVRMKGTLRSLSDETLDRMTKRVEAIVKRTAQAYECRVDILWKEKIPAVWNSSEMTKEAIRCVEKSSSSIVNAPPTLVGEDFVLYRRYVPSFFFWVGSRKVGADIHELHTPQFFADDSAITYAAELYAACAV